MQLDHQTSHSGVKKELDWLREHPDFVQRLAQRMKRYAPIIFRELDRRSMPGELLFLAMIESSLDPFAFSPGGAAGLWQFMPATGERFGLKVDWWADERRDPILATRAALTYLQLLHRRFDSWELAIAAYNAGEGRISSAVREAGSTDFSQLRLPSETAGYLPRLLAFSEVFMYPETYGLRLPKVNARVSQRVVETDSQLNLNRAAHALGVTVQDLYDWNPALNQRATHPKGPHRLLIGETDGQPQLLIDQIPAAERLTSPGNDEGLIKEVNYRVRSGDSLSRIAQRFNVTTREIMGWNELDLAKYLQPGQRLRLYVDLYVAN